MTPDARTSPLRILLDAAGLRALSIVGLGVASVLPALFVMPAPFLVQRAFGIATGGGAPQSLVAVVGAMVGLLLVGEAVALGVRIAALRLTKPAMVNLRERLAWAVVSLPLEHVERRAALVHDVFVHDTERVDVMLNAVAALALPASVLALLLSAALVVAHPAFGLTTLVAAACVVFSERLTRRRMHLVFRRSHETFGAVSRGAWSLLGGFQVVRAHAAERHEVGLRRLEAEAASDASEQAARAAALATAVSRATTALAFGVLLLGAGILVQRGAMTIPAMLAVYASIALLRGPLNTLSMVAPQLQEGWHAWRRVADLLGASAQVIGGHTPPPPGPIVVDRVACRHGERVLFEQVSLAVQPGELVALTGPNGVGKTTLIRYILGLAHPHDGSVRVGGVPLDEIDIAAWRRSLGVVLQETWLFDGTVRDNLVYGAPHVTDADIARACRAAHVDGLLRFLPDGLETVIGASGVRLSDGQRQRLAIARALVRSPRLLIMDEPTNHLDSQAATAIIASIVELPARPAVIVVTHDAEVTGIADRVFTLADGVMTLRERDRRDGPPSEIR